MREHPDTFGALYKCHTFCAQIPTQIQEPDPSAAIRRIQRVQRQEIHSENEVQSFLCRSDLDGFDIIVVAFAKPPRPDVGQFPLPISSGLFGRATQVLDTAPAFLAVMHTGVASFLATRKGKNGAPGQRSEQIIMQQTRSHSHFSMCLTTSETGKTRILIFGAQGWSVSQLFDSLESANLSFGDNTIFIPAAVLDLQAHWFNGTINSLKQRVGEIEDTTGMRKPINHDDLQHPAPDWKDLDMVPITGELSSLLSRISFLKMQTETALYLIQRMHHQTRARTDKTVRRFRYQNHEHELFTRLESTRGWFIGLMAQCDYLARRTSAQSETVGSALTGLCYPKKR